MRTSVRLALLASVLATAAPALASTVVPGTASIYPTAPSGSTPGVDSSLFGAASVTFVVNGTITYNGGNYNNADGFGSVSDEGVNAAGGVSGISGPRAGFLVGVFEDAAGPSTGTTPASLSFNGAGATTFTSLSPLLNQAFYIGDGLSADNDFVAGSSTVSTLNGVQQVFFVPTGATRLVLGFADAPGYHGDPGAYGDNAGSLLVSVNITPIGQPGSAVPEPASWAMMLGGFGLLGGALRRARATRLRLA